MRFRGIAGLLVIGLWATARASDGEIRLQFSDDVCQGSIACGDHRRLYVYAVLDGATRNGITGVEYGMRLGNDGAAEPGWAFSETFAPGTTVAIGTGSFSPPDERAVQPRLNRGRGVNVAWGECERGEHRMVLIEMVEIVNGGCDSEPLRVTVQDHDRPGNQFFRCPLATLCDPPVFTKVCLGENVMPCTNPEGPRGEPAQCSTSGSVLINAPDTISNPCRPTAVQPSTWTGVKGLYR